MRVLVNGESQEVEDGAHVADLLPADCRGTAVAVNGTVVPRAAQAATALRQDDAVEIVRAVQGG